jgi:sugar phosphate permease
MEILICLIFAGVMVLIIAVVAFKYGKQTTNNYGTIHNHYYGQEEKETPTKALPESNVLQLAKNTVEILKEVNQIKNGNPQSEISKLEK